MEEVLDIIDAENSVVGEASKEEVHAEGHRHRITAVLLKNTDGAFLIMSASSLRGDPGRLRFSTAGHVRKGESYLAAAKREVQEEAGIDIEEKDLKPLGSFWLPPEQGSRDSKSFTRWEIFLANYISSMGPITLNEEHTENFWLDLDGLKEIDAKEPGRISPALRIALEKFLNFSR